MNLDSENLGIPETEFSSVCTMPSPEFNRICREFGGLSETIKIETNKECIKFSITGEVGTGNAVLNQRETGDENEVSLQVDEPVSLSFAARYLNLFSKAAGLSSQVSLYMSGETPLMVEYRLAHGGGELKYYLAPKITEEE
jgi:proliferating cell nuclear antigen